jgi:hypothetical protein
MADDPRGRLAATFVDPRYVAGQPSINVSAYRAKWQLALDELQAEASRIIVEAGGDPLAPQNPHLANIRHTLMLNAFDTAKDAMVKYILASAWKSE